MAAVNVSGGARGEISGVEGGARRWLHAMQPVLHRAPAPRHCSGASNKAHARLDPFRHLEAALDDVLAGVRVVGAQHPEGEAMVAVPATLSINGHGGGGHFFTVVHAGGCRNEQAAQPGQRVLGRLWRRGALEGLLCGAWRSRPQVLTAAGQPAPSVTHEPTLHSSWAISLSSPLTGSGGR